MPDVVGGYLLLRSFEALNLEFQVSRSFYFFAGGKLMHIYLHIDVAFVLFAIVEILKVTLMIIEKMQKALITTSNGKRLVLQH